jgi:hypothetical protein
MKISKTLIAAALLSSINPAHSQTYPLFQTSDDIDIGDIRAAHLVHGDMWWDGDSLPKCEFPKGSGKHVGFAGQFSIVAKDPSNNLLVSAQNYRGAPSTRQKTDFWPGPIDPNATTPAQKYAINQQWARIWKVSSNEIQGFISSPNHSIDNIPAVILEWPAKGNTHAKGAAGAQLTITEDMAPFVDVNSDGIYDALAGDYPKIKGNQMLWWVFNDDGPEHGITASAPLKVEVRMTAFAYGSNTVAQNIIFYEHEIVNKSRVTLSDVRVGIRNESDLGYAFDDFIGFDSSYRMGIIYNGKSVDGSGRPNEYGVQIPIMGVIMLDLPGDNQTARVPVGSFGMKNNTINAWATPQDYWDELHFTYPSSSYGFTLNSECMEAHPPGDRRFALASNDLILNPGEKKKIATALIVSSPNAGGCPNTNYTGIKDVADTAIALYRENPPTTSVGPVSGKTALHIYPNPATDVLHIETADQTPGSLNVFDAMGRSIQLVETRTAGRIDVNTSQLPCGVYLIRYQNNGQSFTATFVRK